jgi:hypothetical protein
LLVAYVIIFSTVLFLAFNSIFVLKLLQQLELETTGKPKTMTSLITIPYYVTISLPIIIIWASLDFVFTVIQAIISSFRSSDKTEEANLESFARTLSGNTGDVTFLMALLGLIKKSLRMVAFLCLTALIWEEKNPFSALSNALRSFSNHPKEFTKRFVVSWAVIACIAIPPGIIFILSSKLRISFPDWVWVGVIIYSGIAWSFMIYSEIILMASLYMWHMKWKKMNETRKKAGKEPIEFSDVPPPKFADNIRDLYLIRNPLPIQYTVHEGDNLGELSEEFYGDDKYWRLIAEANNLKHGSHDLEVYSNIIIPEIDCKSGIITNINIEKNI